MEPHSSTLAWKIPWTEDPGRLQSMGSLRVRQDWVTSLSLFTFMHWRRKWQPTPVFLPGESQGWRSLVGCCLWGRRVGHNWSDLVAAAAAITQCCKWKSSIQIQNKQRNLRVPLHFCFLFIRNSLKKNPLLLINWGWGTNTRFCLKSKFEIIL